MHPSTTLAHSTLRGLWILAMASILSGCATAPAAIPDLVCEVAPGVEKTGDCSGIPTLLGGKLRLSKRGTFELTGHYDGCYQIEEVRIVGTFQAAPHEGGVDLELLARRTEGGDPEARKLPRTIGLVNLDTRTLEARFTDTAALIRSHGQMPGPAPSVAMTCSKN